VNRSTPLVRTGFKRKEPSFSRSEHPRAKEGRVEVKEVKQKKCEWCPQLFTPKHMGHTFCSPKCLFRHRKAKEAEEKARRKAEKAQDKARSDALKSVSEWEDECRKIVQEIARIRDRKEGCISCHMGPNYGGLWHGSHFRSVGACSALQFHLWNIHKACAQCNLHKSGNIAAYRPRLVEKIGVEKVEWLECQNDVTKRSGKVYIAYLQRFKKVMGKRRNRLKKWAAR
jgi:hypothetical protein